MPKKLYEFPKDPLLIMMGKIQTSGNAESWSYVLVDHYEDGRTLVHPRSTGRGPQPEAVWSEYTRAATSRTASPFPELHGPGCQIYDHAAKGYQDHLEFECTGPSCAYFADPGNVSNMTFIDRQREPTCETEGCANNTLNEDDAPCEKCFEYDVEHGWACRNPKCGMNQDVSEQLYCYEHLDSLIDNGFLCGLCDHMRTDLRDSCRCPEGENPPEPEGPSKYLLPSEHRPGEDERS